jgi:SAM-dependent methyltransferase
VTGPAFDAHANEYDSWFLKNPHVLASEVLLLKRFLLHPGRAVSIGCGSGLFESILRNEHGIEIREGVEPAEGMARIARARGLEVIAGAAESIPHPDGVFDNVLMNGIPGYLADLGRTLAEGFRILKPGGFLLVADVPASSGYGLLYQLAAAVGTWEHARLRKVAPRDPYPVEFVVGAHWRTTEEIVELMKAVGFRDFEHAQTLTTHAKYSNDAVEDPSPGYDRGGYVLTRGRKPEYS